MSTLIVRGLFALVEINAFVFPDLYVIGKYLSVALPYWLMSIWLMSIVVSTVLSYLLVTRQAFLRTSERTIVAVTLGFCAMMMWISLFDIVHPGIVWRQASGW